MTKEAILEKVKAFPPLDDTVAKVMAICNDVEGSIGDLAKAVETDPMTTANIIKAANSPLYGFSREIKSIMQAVSIFGMDTVKGFAFSSFLLKKPDLNLEPYAMDAKDFSSISQAQNAFISKWYKGQKEKLNVLSLSAFLMEVGKIVLASVVVENDKIDMYKEKILAVETLEDLRSVEIEIFGMTNEEVSSILFQEWNFDEDMYDTIKNLHTPSEAQDNHIEFSQVLHVTKTLTSSHNYNKQPAVEEAIALVEQYGLDKDKFERALEEQFNIAVA
jgi:HD-like signal output (HDOD) protein